MQGNTKSAILKRLAAVKKEQKNLSIVVKNLQDIVNLIPGNDDDKNINESVDDFFE